MHLEGKCFKAGNAANRSVQLPQCLASALAGRRLGATPAFQHCPKRAETGARAGEEQSRAGAEQRHPKITKKQNHTNPEYTRSTKENAGTLKKASQTSKLSPNNLFWTPKPPPKPQKSTPNGAKMAFQVPLGTHLGEKRAKSPCTARFFSILGSNLGA